MYGEIAVPRSELLKKWGVSEKAMEVFLTPLLVGLIFMIFSVVMLILCGHSDIPFLLVVFLFGLGYGLSSFLVADTAGKRFFSLFIFYAAAVISSPQFLPFLGLTVLPLVQIFWQIILFPSLIKELPGFPNDLLINIMGMFFFMPVILGLIALILEHVLAGLLIVIDGIFCEPEKNSC